MTKPTATPAPAVHHATTKRAETNGVTLSWEPKHQQFSASKIDVYDKPRFVRQVEAKQALADLLAIFEYEAAHPAIRIQQTLVNGVHSDFAAVFHSHRSTVIDRNSDLADLISDLNEMDDEEIDALKPESEGGGVVPIKYKQRYAANGDPTTCGDWLAQLLNHYCQVEGEIVKESKLVSQGPQGRAVTHTNLDFVEAIAVANGVDTPRMDKLGRESNGWQGRYRMTVRNMLTKRVCLQGFLVIPEGVAQTHEEHAPPAEWLARYSPKPKETGKEKRAAAPSSSTIAIAADEDGQPHAVTV